MNAEMAQVGTYSGVPVGRRAPAGSAPSRSAIFIRTWVRTNACTVQERIRDCSLRVREGSRTFLTPNESTTFGALCSSVRDTISWDTQASITCRYWGRAEANA